MDWLSFCFGLIVGVTLAHIFVMILHGKGSIIMRPDDIEQYNYSLNTFGRWIVYILIAICSPIIFICKVIYMLMHSRRKVSSRKRENVVTIPYQPENIKKYLD